MKNLVVKYLEKKSGVCEVKERNGEKVFDEYNKGGDIYFDFEDMFEREYDLLEDEFDFDEIENIEIIFEKV